MKISLGKNETKTKTHSQKKAKKNLFYSFQVAYTNYLATAYSRYMYFFSCLMNTEGNFHHYKSFLTPKPGPVGGFNSDVKPPCGSDANRPLLGPAFGVLLAFKSSMISAISLAVRSS